MYSTMSMDEEMEAQRRERARQKQMMQMLVDGAEDWWVSLRATPKDKLLILVLIALLLSAYVQFIFPLLAAAFLYMQLILGCKSSCCFTTGTVALGVAALATMVQPGPGVLATPFFELPLCHNSSTGSSSSGLFGLHAPGGGACRSVDRVNVPIARGKLDRDRAYRPVLLLPAGSHASLILTVLDANGQPLFFPTKLELGPDDKFPNGHVKAPPAPSSSLLAASASTSTTASTSTSSTSTSTSPSTSTSAAAAASSVVAGASAAAASTPESFDASTRRTRNRRRLRGIGGLMRMGGGGFSRGTGSFLSPNRGVSQGPSALGRGATSAFGGARVSPGAVGRPGATYFRNTPFAGGGYYPAMGYNPSLGFDIATGMMIGHMLRTPIHRRPQSVLHGPAAGAPALDAPTALALPAPVRYGSYYYGEKALHPGSVLAAALYNDSAGGLKSLMRTLNTTYDRYALLDELSMPAAPEWPLRVSISAFEFAANASSAASPPIFLGMQAAGPPRLRSTILTQTASRLLQMVASFLLLALAAAALAGASPRRLAHLVESAEDDFSESELELGAVHHAHGLQPAAVPAGAAGAAQPVAVAVGRPVGSSTAEVASAQVVPQAMACAGSSSTAGHPTVSADGEILSEGSRVQTQWTRARGGDDSWFAGTILTIHGETTPQAGHATIIYDDGVEWTGRFNEIYVLQGEDEANAPQQPQASTIDAAASQQAMQPTVQPDRTR